MQKMLVKVRRDNDIYKKSFKKFDQDGNGFIDKDELRSVLCGNGSSMSEAEVEVLLHEADVDGDGKLSYEGNKIFDAIN
jgi:Ca2+-binding EF-hand superfamily protein